MTTPSIPQTRYPLAFARERAESLMRTLAPHCDRIRIGGSIRRELPHVKDIELIAIPKWEDEEPIQHPLFGDLPHGPRLRHNRLLAYLRAVGATDRHDLARHVKFTAGRPIEGDRHDINVDLFLATPANWGNISMIRTGSADFARAMLARWKAVSGGGFSSGGYLHRFVSPVNTPEESDVFRLCEVPYIEPPYRTDALAIVDALRRSAR